MADGSDSASKGSATLRPGAVTALLQELADAPESPNAWEAILRPGSVVGRFELVRELGRGGFGVVGEARDRELGRSVALKAVRPGARADLREERLLREAEAAARLSHPNIVTVFDLGRVEQGPYLVLELLRGETLEARLSKGPLPVRDALRIAAEVASAAAHAHRAGVAHRDLKPANVFLCDDGRTKVLDFGLAHAFGHRRERGGTSGYMAPEQLEGAPEDERTDVWAIGALLFEMLTGELPFASEGALRRPPPDLSVPGLPALGALVRRMLATRPVDRPRDGGEALSSLTAIAAELDRSPGPAASAVRLGKRVPRVALLAGGIAIVAAIAAAVAWGHRREGAATGTPAAPVALAVLPLANLSGDPGQEYFSDGMTEEIIGKLSHLGGLAVTARGSVARYKGASRDAREVGKALGVAYVLDGSVRRAGDRIRVSATLVKAADGFQVWSESIDAKLDDVFGVQERVATRIVEALHVRLTPDEAGSLRRWGTRNAAAYDEYLRGQALVEHFYSREKLVAARGHFERALAIDAAFAPAMAGLASAEAQTYRNVDSSPSHLERARALLRSALAIDPALTRALFTSGEVKGVSYDYRGAAEDFRRVLAAEPMNYQAWDYLCWVLGWSTPPEAEAAEQACRRAIELNPGYAESYYHLARALLPQRRLAEANQALDQLEEQFQGSYLVPSGRFWVRLAEGRPREALAFLKTDPQILSTAFGHMWLSAALAQTGEVDAAFAALETALARGYRDLTFVRASPYFEPLRRDRRFAPLLARYDVAARPEASLGSPAASPPPASDR